MKFLLRFLGRVLFVSLLFSLAYQKIQHPEKFRDAFLNAYTNIYSALAHNSYVPLFPDASFASYLPVIIKGLGLFEAFLASFVLIGNKGATAAALLYFIAGSAYTHIFPHLTHKTSSEFANKENIMNDLALLGVLMLITAH